MSKKDEIIEYIKNNIKTNKWKKGEKIPSNYQLSKKFGIALNTAQVAVRELVVEGILTSKRGSGVYVTDTLPKESYIIISAHERNIMNNISETYSKILNYLRKYIEEIGLKPYLFVERTTNNENLIVDTIDIDLSQVKGLISITGNEFYYKALVDRGIPCINIMNFKSHNYPGVSFDVAEIIRKIDEIAEKFNNVLVLNFETPLAMVNAEYLLIYGKNSYLSDHYNTKIIRDTSSKKELTEQIENVIKNLETEPDLIVFTDDNLYINSISLFNKYDIFHKAKILTHSNNDEVYPKDMKICRLAYDLKKLSKKAFELLVELINNKRVLHYNYEVSFEVINEDCLYERGG